MKNVIEQLDKTILSLLEQRMELQNENEGFQSESKCDLGTSILFTDLLKKPSFKVQPYDEFFDGYLVGFDPEKETVVYLHQKCKTDPLLSPCDHHFTVDLSVVDPKGSDWISLERIVATSDVPTNVAANVALKVKSEEKSNVTLSMIIKFSDGDHIFIPIENMILTGQGYDEFFVSKRLNLKEYGVEDPSRIQECKVSLFFARDKACSYNLATFTVLFSEYAE